jgi:hypothetical protein
MRSTTIEHNAAETSLGVDKPGNASQLWVVILVKATPLIHLFSQSLDWSRTRIHHGEAIEYDKYCCVDGTLNEKNEKMADEIMI